MKERNIKHCSVPVVEHCVNSAKGCRFNSQGTHIQKMYSLKHCKSLWIKASAKCINVIARCFCIEKDVMWAEGWEQHKVMRRKLSFV